MDNNKQELDSIVLFMVHLLLLDFFLENSNVVYQRILWNPLEKHIKKCNESESEEKMIT